MTSIHDAAGHEQKENMTPHLVSVAAGGFDAACNEMRRVELTITEVNNNEI